MNTHTAGWDNRLDPPEEQTRRKVGNIWEIWVPCEYCEGEGRVLTADQMEVEDDVTGEPYMEEVSYTIECPHCHGNQGVWDMEVDE
jgi:hypothetical protein